MLSFREKKN